MNPETNGARRILDEWTAQQAGITHKPEFSSAAASRQQVCAAGFFTAPLKQDNVVPDIADTAITVRGTRPRGTRICDARHGYLRCPAMICACNVQ